MSENDPPAISVILATPNGGRPGLGAVVRSFAAQPERGQIELVVIVASRDMFHVAEDQLRGFWGVRVIEIGPFNSWSQAMVVGVKAASAQWVVLGEDHSYAAPGWAGAMIQAQRGDWAAVGPSIDNANPRAAMSWASLLVHYGLWLRPTPADGRIPYDSDLPGHNSSYRRDVLLAFGEASLREMTRYNRLHQALREQGKRLFMEPRAVVFHLNPSRWVSSLPPSFSNGRRFGGMRAREGRWSIARRLLYVIASPLIPFVGLKSVAENLRRSGRWDLARPSVLSALATLVCVTSAGEVAGYLLGPGDISNPRADAEFERFAELCRSDQLARDAVYSSKIASGAA